MWVRVPPSAPIVVQRWLSGRKRRSTKPLRVTSLGSNPSLCAKPIFVCVVQLAERQVVALVDSGSNPLAHPIRPNSTMESKFFEPKLNQIFVVQNNKNYLYM